MIYYPSFSLFGMLFSVAFIIFIVFFIINMVGSVKTYSYNNNSPTLTVTAKIVAKRSTGTINDNYNNALYYMTFEVESGDRIELVVPENDYGLLIEGDFGDLTFQGEIYKGFRRFKQM